MEAVTPTLKPSAPAAPTSTLAPPTGTQLLVAAGGFFALGLAASLGSGSAATITHNLPGTLFTSIGALVLTGPALLVAHQFLRLEASPVALATALGRGFHVSGRLALGLAAPMLFFSATSTIWTTLLTLALFAIGAMGLHATLTWLVNVETRAGADLAKQTHMYLLSLAWCALTGLTALRIAVDALLFV